MSIHWNTLSILFDIEIKGLQPANKKGYYLVPLFLDHLLEDSCSQEVRDAFERAIRIYMKKEIKHV